LPEESHVSLTVYDLMGKQITSLVSESQAAGVRTVTWDGTDASGKNVSAGVYLYRIQAGEFSQTRKMVLLK
jgi:flagellar hook assembly protein FlgD